MNIFSHHRTYPNKRKRFNPVNLRTVIINLSRLNKFQSLTSGSLSEARANQSLDYQKVALDWVNLQICMDKAQLRSMAYKVQSVWTRVNWVLIIDWMGIKIHKLSESNNSFIAQVSIVIFNPQLRKIHSERNQSVPSWKWPNKNISPVFTDLSIQAK